MKETVKIPDTVSDMDMSHLPFFLALSRIEIQELEDLTPTEVADLNCLFFSSNQGDFDKYDTASNQQILAEIVKSCATVQQGDIRPTITVEGITYVWQPDYSKTPVSFHRDISNADWEEHPLDLVAFCYVEQGMVYNQLDDYENIVNPKRERANALSEQFNLQQYLDVQGFFLESYSVLRPYLKVKEARRNRSGGIGKKV